MCFLEKVDYLIWVDVEGLDRKAMLRLQRDQSGKTYNDFFTIERVIDGTATTEVLYKLPFKELASISYSPIEGTDRYRIDLDMSGAPMRDITVERHCLDYLTFRKMKKIHEKSRR